MSDLDVSRRGFLVLIGGTVLGTYALPGGVPGAPAVAEAAATAASPLTRRLLSRPLRRRSVDRVFAATQEPAFFLLWTELDAEDNPHVMIWTPETREEIAEANRFYDEARALNPGPKIDLPPLIPEAEALVEAVLDAPEREEPRRAYAAFLRAQGNSQGEFVEVNLQLEKLAPDDPAREDLDVRWSDLLNNDAETWLAPLASLGLRPDIFGTYFPALWLAATGFVEELDLETPDLLPDRAEELIRAAPLVHRLKIAYDDVDLAALAGCPYLARLSSLDLSSLNLQADAVQPILDSPYMLRLRQLDLGYNELGAEFGAALAQAGFLPRLRELVLNSIDLAEGAVDLFGAWTQGDLRGLNLAGNQLGLDALTALANCPALQRLESLNLADNSLDAECLRALATAPFLASLTDLDLSGCHLDAEALKVLVGLSLPNLTTLKLSSNHLDAAGAAVLAHAHWPRLTHLELDSCELGDAGLLTLAGSSLLVGLHELSLRENRLGPRGVAGLAKVAWAGPLRVLNLRQNRCAEEGAKALAGCTALSGLEELDLNGNNLGAVGAGALATSSHLAGLRKLHVTVKFLGPTGKAALLGRFGEDVMQMDEDA
jgi:Ran GTPase-activating protein (RanGAP) involved in mRNA processing and transport